MYYLLLMFNYYFSRKRVKETHAYITIKTCCISDAMASNKKNKCQLGRVLDL